uniref:Uncharacterized protein n=1 Tax=Anguilla anguilla TaxID=7936 RepID=A0A0E9WIA1_ANGAN
MFVLDISYLYINIILPRVLFIYKYNTFLCNIITTMTTVIILLQLLLCIHIWRIHFNSRRSCTVQSDQCHSYFV